MLNRTLRVDVVKKEKEPTVNTNQFEDSFADKATITGVVVEGAIKKIGIAVCAYVVLDTIRRVAVASASA
ncbi:MAG: hypothetical protein ABWY25_06275 [Paenisporosarcina sp.]